MTEQVRVDFVSDSEAAIADIAKMEKRVEQLAKSFTAQNRESVKSAKLAKGSYAALEKELKDNVKQLKNLEVGSKAFDIQKKKVAGLQRQLASAKSEMKGGVATGSRFNQMAATGLEKVAGLAAGMLGLQQGISAIVGELEKAKQLNLAAAGQELSLEAALVDIGMNVGSGQIGAARAMIEKNAAELGTTQVGLANLLGTAISAGAKDLTEAMAVSKAGLELTVGNAGAADELVQTALDVTALSGSDNFRGALGQVAQTASQVRAVNPQDFFKAMGSALAVATADKANIRGITTERALELSATVSQILKDRTGANTAESLSKLITGLNTFVPVMSKTLKDKTKAELSKEEIAEFTQTTTVDERIAMLQSNEAMRRQFLNQTEQFKGKIALEEIVGGTKTATELSAKHRKGIMSLPDAEAEQQGLMTAMQNIAPFLRHQRLTDAAVQQMQTTSERAQRVGQVQVALDKVLSSVDLPGIDQLQRLGAQASFQMSQMMGEDPFEWADRYFQALDNVNVKTSRSPIVPGMHPEHVDLIRNEREKLKMLGQIARNSERQNTVVIPANNNPRPVAPAAAAAP